MFFALKLCTLFTCPNGLDPISSLLLNSAVFYRNPREKLKNSDIKPSYSNVRPTITTALLEAGD